jgi:hypothetical protein
MDEVTIPARVSSFPLHHIVRVAVERAAGDCIRCELFHRGTAANLTTKHKYYSSELEEELRSHAVFVDGIERQVSPKLYRILQAQETSLPIEGDELLIDASLLNEDSISKATSASTYPSWFQYDPLQGQNSIRLIAIERCDMGFEHAPIYCRLVHVDLSTKPIYQALSYEWKHGSTEDPIIYMNGLPHMVRHNLHQALLRFG